MRQNSAGRFYSVTQRGYAATKIETDISPRNDLTLAHRDGKWRDIPSSPMQFSRIPSFPHPFSGNPGTGTGPPIKTFGGDELGIVTPSLLPQFSKESIRLII